MRVTSADVSSRIEANGSNSLILLICLKDASSSVTPGVRAATVRSAANLASTMKRSSVVDQEKGPRTLQRLRHLVLPDGGLTLLVPRPDS